MYSGSTQGHESWRSSFTSRTWKGMWWPTWMRRGVGSKDRQTTPRDNQHNPQCNYWAPLTRKRHQQEHGPQRPTERMGPMYHSKGRTGDCRGPCEETATRRNVTQAGAWQGESKGHIRRSPATPALDRFCLNNNDQRMAWTITLRVMCSAFPLGPAQALPVNAVPCGARTRGRAFIVWLL